GQEHFPVRIEFEYLITFAAFDPRVRHPQIALSIDRCAMWKHKHSLAPTLDQLSRLIEFENRRLAAAGARVVRTAMDDIHTAIGGTFHRGDCGPHASRRTR